MENQKNVNVENKENSTKVVTRKPSEKSDKKSRTEGAKRPVRKESRRPKREEVRSEFNEKVVDIARVTKVVKGGRRFSFSAFVVVGNGKGLVGYGHGKANEVPDAIKKAVKDAQNNLVNVPLYNGTVPHETNAKFLASKVMLKPAPKGKGLIASGTVRAVVELAGYTDIVTKTYGSRSKVNIVKATVEALKVLRTPEQIAQIRDKDVKDLI
ncbi:30S ribosomal protein S5 [Mycoplasmopsis pullorum]|uniref:Small ribosomal subunit protein uS5 n=1 Tax=Mycoplasmopsis pullorum TaxID=48003 RepID=A0A1L4FS31_9BACT|nr:30S ribosomal protein S5 [Mycoplasmopsis pullorum]APJ38420.1 30S ribosomal protein S5 [Mycoplasmopsis pullorum]TNK84052.1 30S ribosomal protein S5 [Mycoplasmopsis pullorum]TNK92431.1 30S ribosomal protein S5 [Mycoplasmopsis pullorum]